MLSIVGKYVFPLVAMSIGLSQPLSAQDFFKDYRNYLNKETGKVTARRKALIDSSIHRLRITTDRFKTENGRSFFATDTVYFVSFLEAETSFSSEIIWTKNASCYYRYSYQMVHWKKINQKLEVLTNAAAILKSFNKSFRRVIEAGDTSAYRNYADTHKVFDGEWVSPVMAVKDNGHWKFLVFNGNGWAISYDFEPVSPNKKN